ncbi:hypothetical protein F2P56_029565 [Juglans regia]|uniref:Uncharacterized protein LOC109019130 n=2 Tax=Juglans regia TaxID=51240 RepID=A0A2I4HLC6_JUGRE|nr:uncharacterized protein LOC109019130 [Juglans regia]XP_035542911.1 uncharacterized protein LOC118345730 [Juglans regia]KAF5449083.1 hypothetical protein F2P56_029565 [Juglans regia]
MDSSASNPKTSYHARSNSLPSSPHPLIAQVNEYLCRLRASEATSSSSSMSHNIVGLQDLHDCVDKLLLLPLSTQSLAQQQQEKWVNELLDGSLRLLDLCNTAKDALLQTKECTQELQSIMRRRRGESMLGSEVRKFLNSRKVVKKAINKALGNLKGAKDKCTFSPSEAENEVVALFSILREAEAFTVTVFESLLSFISGRNAQSKSCRWSLVSKLMYSKRVACEEEETHANEFSKVDAALLSVFMTSKLDNKHVENLQNQLEHLEMCTQDFEDGLECLFRRLIKTRVSLLNVLNH